MFEGEYLNGKKWTGIGYNGGNRISYEIKQGKGNIVLYDDDESGIKLRGAYLNGEINGKVREFQGGELKFEGEYLNGKRNGKGKEYNFQGNVIFEGELYLNHRKKGKEYIKGRLEFEGEFLWDKKWKGKGFDEKGNVIYELIDGKGTIKEYVGEYLVYEGECLDGKRNGKGKEYDHDGNLIFEGEYSMGKKVGKN